MADDPVVSLPDDEPGQTGQADVASPSPFWRRLFERPQARTLSSEGDEVFPAPMPGGVELDDSYYYPPADPAPATVILGTGEQTATAAAETGDGPDDGGSADVAVTESITEAMPPEALASADVTGEAPTQEDEPSDETPVEEQPRRFDFRLPFSRKSPQEEPPAEDAFVASHADTPAIVPGVEPLAAEIAEPGTPDADAPESSAALDESVSLPTETPWPVAEPAATEWAPLPAPSFDETVVEPAAPSFDETVAEPAAPSDDVRPSLLQPTQEFPVVLPVAPPAPAADETTVLPGADGTDAAKTIFDLPAREVTEEAPRIAPLYAVVRVLALPRSTFDRIADEAVVAWPAALAVVLLSSVIKTGVAIGFAARGAVPDSALAGVAVRYGVAVAGPLLLAAAAAGWLLLTQRMWRGEAGYATILSAVSLALIPLSLRNLLQAGFMAATREVLVHPGLSALVAPPASDPAGRAIYGVLGGIDLFTLWTFVLLVVAARVTRGRGWARRTLMVAVFCLVALAFSALSGIVAAPTLAF